jgi:hypothetical protein
MHMLASKAQRQRYDTTHTVEPADSCKLYLYVFQRACSISRIIERRMDASLSIRMLQDRSSDVGPLPYLGRSVRRVQAMSRIVRPAIRDGDIIGLLLSFNEIYL